jgi:serralysin
MPATTLVLNSGNPDIDGVLSGIKWATNSLTYSFPTVAGSYGYAGETATFGAMSTAAQIAVTNILQKQFAAVSGLTFNLVTESPTTLVGTTHGDLRYADSNFDATAAAYYPNALEQGGDVWVHKTDVPGSGTTFGAQFDAPVKGNYAYHSLLHETGHALGLKHGHASSIATGLPGVAFFDALPASHDSMEYSVMTYRSFVNGPSQGDYSNGINDYAQTLMQDDVAGIQYLYGANFGATANNTNSVYTWSISTGEMFINGVGQGAPGSRTILMNVWDGGGVDTYNLSDRTTNLSIDLRPGAWVNLGDQLANLGATLPAGSLPHIAVGNISNSLLYQGDTRSLIENATGGSGNDILYANSAANTLIGGFGTDTLSYVGSVGGVTVNLATGATSGGWAAGDIISGFENLTGSTGDDVLTGDGGNNVLVTLTGNDTAIGGVGNDTVDYSGLATTGVTVSVNAFYGGATKGGANGSDGLALVERFIGSTGNDYFSLRGGAYQVTGGTGNDIYIIDNSGTVLTETANGGTDWVVSAASSTTLTGNFEYLGMTINNSTGTDTSTTGSVTLDALGTGVTLNGGLSDNLYLVHGANATLTDAGGVNTVVAYANTTMSSAFLGTDTMVVVGNNITGTGNNYGNTLMSIGTGNRLVGGSGNEFFIVTAGDEVITEAAGGGFDTVWSQTSVYTMPANVEQLVLLQAGARGIANAVGSLVVAASANNVLQSGTGSDTLWSNGQNVTYDMTGPGFGHDTLANFKGHATNPAATADVIDLRAFNLLTLPGPLTGMSALTFTDSTNATTGVTSTTITIAGNTTDNILIYGYDHLHVMASDFLF